MRKKRFPFISSISVLVQSGAGTPYAIKVDVKKCLTLLKLVSGILFLLFLGTLMFFREMEQNRKLEERLLAIELEKKLTENFTLPRKPTLEKVFKPKPAPKEVARSTPMPPPIVVSAPSLPRKVSTPFGDAPIATKANTKTPTELAETTENGTANKREIASVRARVSNIKAECLEEACTAKVVLIPSGPGVAVGQLLMVLETGIMRIGAATHTSDVRKRYFVSPGNEGFDEMNQTVLDKLQGSPFRFSRALQTSATFQIGKVLKPLAVNIYIFDQSRTLVQHERQVIQLEP